MTAKEFLYKMAVTDSQEKTLIVKREGVEFDIAKLMDQWLQNYPLPQAISDFANELVRLAKEALPDYDVSWSIDSDVLLINVSLSVPESDIMQFRVLYADIFDTVPGFIDRYLEAIIDQAPALKKSEKLPRLGIHSLEK